MKKLNKKAFTLVELIIVIAIIAILAVSASLMLVKWIGKSKDARVISDVSAINRALQVYYADKFSYPTPGVNKEVTLSGVNYHFKEGVIDDTVTSKLSELEKTPKDPYQNYYKYSLSTDNNKYQVAGKKEDGTYVVRGSYDYVAIASGTVGAADVAELPSLFVVDTNGNLSGATLVSGGNYNFIVDGSSIKNISYYYTGAVDLDSGTVIDSIYNKIKNDVSISTGALQAQLKAQVQK